MSDELNGNQDPMIPGDGNGQPALEDKVAELTEQLEREQQARTELTARAKRAEAALKERKVDPQTNNNEAQVPGEIVKDVENLKFSERKRQFGYEHQLSPEETDKVFSISGNNPTADTLKDPFVVAGLDALRASKRVESNTPSSRTSSPFQGKDFAKIPDEDKKSSYEEAGKRFLKKT